ncbi:hypothetical protein P154DRAFT_525600 [Amniculicola lignicola CBS 123094]|uniref:HTH CENPB-type domain-containing protein n=1 Tax=Amniculicola lignicola CBS 123094 TaxID=1392246 RepID=A0A6A5WBG7_9PLEO|nr:hypothetical protein P154DRAFT_525600 [Amniculicola lignicola CBS 123094]
MDPIQDAVTFFKSQEPGEELSYTEVAKRYNINRVTLAQRHQGVQITRAAAKIELVEYIEGLTQRALPPIRAMIRNFASYIARERVGEGWVTRFIHRNKDSLTS